MNETEETRKTTENIKIFIIVLALMVGAVYYFSNPKPQNYYDYTFRVADNIIRGDIAFKEKPPPWLNEFVPFEGNWYSVFPLGSVITMMPFAYLKFAGIVGEMPAGFISAFAAGAICLFLLLLAWRYDLEWRKRILFTLVILFGTWLWTNQTLAGAWQLALGWAMLGELGAIYFTVYNRKPFWAGFFFALAFGNRTEVLLTAPIFMFLLLRDEKLQITDYKNSEADLQKDEAESGAEFSAKKKKSKKKKAGGKRSADETSIDGNENSLFENLKSEISNLKSKFSNAPKPAVIKLAKFCTIPFILGVLTLVYNKIRFHSFTDFGYARIPGVLDEPWYNHGIFSVWYIPGQAYEMLLKTWETFSGPPYLAPDPFSSSILFSSPFLFLLFRRGVRDKVLVFCAWLAIFILTIILWMHGNSGGWQFGYRYATVLLPWIFVILLENSPKKITLFEAAVCAVSFLLNFYALYLFNWTEYMKR